MTTTLHRCRTPTDRLCPCGRVARALRAADIAFDQRRVPCRRRRTSARIVALTGQPLVPVLVEPDGTATHDAQRILARVAGRG